MAANKVVLATSEIVKENSSSKMLLRVDVETPVIIVPMASGNKEDFMTLDLGNIKVRNKLAYVDTEIIDQITIEGERE
jgi:hypothetical protein